MKTSKILFISFFGLIGIFLIALPIQVKKSISETAVLQSSFKKEHIALPTFNHLIVSNNSCLEIGDSERNTLIYSFPEDSLIDEINYQLVGDTLILPYQDTRNKQSVKIKCGSLKSITCKVRLTINKSQDTLNIISETGPINIKGDSFEQINIRGTGGSIRTMNRVEINELNAKLDNTRIIFDHALVQNLNAELEYNAKISINKALNIVIKKDGSSRYEEKNYRNN